MRDVTRAPAIAQAADHLREIRRVRRALLETLRTYARENRGPQRRESRVDPTVAEAACLAGMTLEELTLEVHGLLDRRLATLEEAAEKALADLQRAH